MKLVNERVQNLPVQRWGDDRFVALHAARFAAWFAQPTRRVVRSRATRLKETTGWKQHSAGAGVLAQKGLTRPDCLRLQMTGVRSSPPVGEIGYSRV